MFFPLHFSINILQNNALCKLIIAWVFLFGKLLQVDHLIITVLTVELVMFNQETERGLLPGQWRDEASYRAGFIPLSNGSSNNYAQDARIVRDNFRDFFNSEEGSVPWKRAMVMSTSNRFDED